MKSVKSIIKALVVGLAACMVFTACGAAQQGDSGATATNAPATSSSTATQAPASSDGATTQSPASSDSTTTQAPASSESTAATTTAPAAPEIQKMKITGTTSWNSVIKTVDYAEYHIWDVVNESLKNRGVELEVEIIPIDQMQMVTQTRLSASVDLPDVFFIGFLDRTQQINFANQGMFVPLQDVLEYSDGTARDFYNGPGEYAVKLNAFPDGNTYWYTSYLSTMWDGELKGNAYTISIRRDWLTKFDLPTPTTAEEFLTALKTFRDEDANDNGANDEVLAVAPYFNTSISGWFDLGSEIAYVDPDAQKVLTPWYQPGVKDYIVYMKRLVDEGILDVTAFERTTELAVDNKLSATIGYCTMALEGQVNVGDAPDAEYLPIGPLTSTNPGLKPRGTGDSAVAQNSPFAVTKACKNLETVAKFLDFITGDEYAVLGEWGIEGEAFEMVDGIPIRAFEGNRQLMEDNRVSNMFWLFGNCIFPRMNLGENLNITTLNAKDYKLDYLDKFPSAGNLLSGNNETIYMAIPTEEEFNTISEISTDLKTYSEETMLKLMLGQLSLDNWDTYISDLKTLGLDEYLEIMAARYDRYMQ